MDAGKKVRAFFDYYGGFEAIVIEHTVHRDSKLRTKVTALDCLWLLSPPTWVMLVIL